MKKQRHIPLLMSYRHYFRCVLANKAITLSDWWQLFRETSHHALWECCCCVQGQCVLLERTEENVRTHVSVVQREGPGSVLFSADGSRGGWGRVFACVLGALLECVLRVKSLFILAVSRMSAKMMGHAPLFTHSLSPGVSVKLLLLSICSSMTFSFRPLFSLHHLCLAIFFFFFYLLCTQLYTVQGQWPDN